MTITETTFWNEVERLDAIKTADCPDCWQLMQIKNEFGDSAVEDFAAAELGDAERWHIGMGCARCHRIMMLARLIAFEDVEATEPVTEAPAKKVIPFPRTWRSSGLSQALAASDRIDIPTAFYLLDGDRFKVRIGSAEKAGEYQIDLQSTEDRACMLRIFDGDSDAPGGGEIVLPTVKLYAMRTLILPFSERDIELYRSFRRPDVEITEVPEGDITGDNSSV